MFDGLMFELLFKNGIYFPQVTSLKKKFDLNFLWF